MEDFKKYADNKRKIAELEKECDELKDKLIPQVKILDAPMKYAGGKFYLMTRKNYKFSSTLNEIEKDMKEKVTILKDEEIKSGVAVESVTESLVFSLDK